MARASQEWPQQHSGQNAAQGTGRLPRQYDRPMHGIVRNNTGRMGRLMLGLGVANRRDNGCATPKGFLRRDSPCGGASSAKTCPFVGRINPLIRRISIVLPEPFIPRRPITRPRSEQRDTFLITTSPCIDFVTFFTSRNIRIPPCLKYPCGRKRRSPPLSMLN